MIKATLKQLYRHLCGALVLTLIMLACSPVMAADHPILYLFWGEGCPHCEKEQAFLRQLQTRYPNLEMRWFEIWGHRDFLKLAEALRKTYQVKGPVSVPITFIGDFVNVGFQSDETTGIEFEEKVVACQQKACPDTLDKVNDLPIVQRIHAEIASNTPQQWQWFPAAPRQENK